jgi:hypothetical protein
VNIGFACSLLRTDMALYRVTAEPPAVLKLEDAGQFAEVRRAPRARRAALHCLPRPQTRIAAELAALGVLAHPSLSALYEPGQAGAMMPNHQPRAAPGRRRCSRRRRCGSSWRRRGWPSRPRPSWPAAAAATARSSSTARRSRTRWGRTCARACWRCAGPACAVAQGSRVVVLCVPAQFGDKLRCYAGAGHAPEPAGSAPSLQVSRLKAAAPPPARTCSR